MKFKKNLSALLMPILLPLIFLFEVHCSTAKKASPLRGLQWAIRMAESVVIRHPNVYYKWDYVTGTVLRGFEELWLVTGERKYYNYIQQTVDSSMHENGFIDDYTLSDFNIDEVNEGRMLLFLYKESHEEKYKKAAKLIRSQLAGQPRNSLGGFWHKEKYPYQMWLDGLYMGAPFYAEYAKLFGEPDNFDDVIRQFVLSSQKMRDARTGLLYHGWDEQKVQDWADPVTGLSECIWGRAMGWYMMALVDVLDYIPTDHSGRGTLVEIFQSLAESIVKVQDKETGVWWQVMDQGGREGNYLEASGSCMFVYALAKGVRKGVIDPQFREIAETGYQGILKYFISETENGELNLNGICQSAGLGFGRDGSYEYYTKQEPVVANDGKGIGPFITASIEIYKLNLK